MAMAQGWKINLLLLGTVLLLGGGLAFLGEREAQHQEAERVARAVSPIPAGQATRLQFTGDDAIPVLLEKKGTQWVITAPQQVRSDQNVVQELLKLLDGVYDRRATDRADNPAAFGLTTPPATLVVENAAGVTHQLTLGGATPVGNNRYLQIGRDGPIALLSQTSVAGLLLGYPDLRDRRLFQGVEVPAITRFRLTPRQGPPVELEHREGGEWRLIAPLTEAAHEQRVTSWLQMLVLAGGSGFRNDLPATPADWTLTLTAQGREQEVTLWHHQDELLARRSGEPDALVLYNQLLDELAKDPLSLVALRPLPPGERLEVAEIAYEGRTESARLTNGKWPKPAWETLSEVLEREAWRVEPPKERGEPRFTVTLGAGNDSRQVPFWKEGEVYLLAPPGRQVHLQLSTLQSETLRDAVLAIFGQKEAAPSGAPGQPPVGSGTGSATP